MPLYFSATAIAAEKLSASGIRLGRSRAEREQSGSKGRQMAG